VLGGLALLGLPFVLMCPAVLLDRVPNVHVLVPT
jgi:hypothetical protein